MARALLLLILLCAACGDDDDVPVAPDGAAMAPPDAAGPDAPAPRCGDGTVDPQRGEDCDDGDLDDGDGCDHTCQDESQVEVCGNGLDDDDDFRADCDDPDCWPVLPGCAREDCDNGVDDNLDDAVDCDDPDCRLEAACSELSCADGLDGDGNGASDCADADCAEFTACIVELCANDADDDRNGALDCADPDCAADPACDVCGDGVVALALGERCDDGNVAGGDGCSAACLAEPGHEDCVAAGDQDGDGQANCADPDCAGFPGCPGPERCADPPDEDGDGWFDCADPDCAGLAPCGPPQPNGAACAGNGGCAGGFCIPEELYGWPAGYCTSGCDPAAPACPGGGPCLDVGMGNGICLDGCASTGHCRPGYGCFDLIPGQPACWPDCTAPGHCVRTGQCNLWTGSCVPDLGRGRDGAACAVNDDCESGFCIAPDDTWTGGYCTSVASTSLQNCPDGLALNLGGSIADLGFCLDGCESTAECRADEGYTCRNLAGWEICFP